MNIRIASVLVGLLTAGCAVPGFLATDTAHMPANADGRPALTQNEAIALASWALKDPATTRDNPERAARAIAAADWLAGQTNLTGEFGTYAPVNEVSWGTFRRQARAAIGVPNEAPSQVLVERLLAAADALKAGQPATGPLTDPIFTRGPDATLAALANLPKLPARDWAFAELNRHDDMSHDCHFPAMC